MQFKENDKELSVSEPINGEWVRVRFVSNQQICGSNYVISPSLDLSEKHLRELRKWLTIQIRKIAKTKTTKKSIPLTK